MTDIEKLRELLGKATPGPWEVDNDMVFYGDIETPNYGTVAHIWTSQFYVENPPKAIDAELIATLRNAIGPLLDRMEKMEANVRRYEVIRHKMPPLTLAKILRIEWTDILPEQDIDEKIDELCDAALRGKGE